MHTLSVKALYIYTHTHYLFLTDKKIINFAPL
jgi:hypothetical protein